MLKTLVEIGELNCKDTIEFFPQCRYLFGISKILPKLRVKFCHLCLFNWSFLCNCTVFLYIPKKKSLPKLLITSHPCPDTAPVFSILFLEFMKNNHDLFSISLILTPSGFVLISLRNWKVQFSHIKVFPMYT